MNDEFTLKLNSPITEEQWDAITDVDFENTDNIWFHTKHGKDVEFVKPVRCKDCRYFGVLNNIPLSCSYWIDVTEANDYCSRGEVKDDEHRSN